MKKFSLLQKFFAALSQIILKVLQENFGIVKNFSASFKNNFQNFIFWRLCIIFLHIGKIAYFQDYFLEGGGGGAKVTACPGAPLTLATPLGLKKKYSKLVYVIFVTYFDYSFTSHLLLISCFSWYAYFGKTLFLPNMVLFKFEILCSMYFKNKVDLPDCWFSEARLKEEANEQEVKSGHKISANIKVKNSWLRIPWCSIRCLKILVDVYSMLNWGMFRSHPITIYVHRYHH